MRGEGFIFSDAHCANEKKKEGERTKIVAGETAKREREKWMKKPTHTSRDKGKERRRGEEKKG